MTSANLPPSQTFQTKEPWLAVNLSCLLPGLGQMYAGQFSKGGVFLFGEILLITFASSAFFSPTGNSVTALWLLLPIVGFYIFNLVDAYHSLPRSISPQPASTSSKTNPSHTTFKLSQSSRFKEPWFAVFLSQILPGLGHFYLEELLLGSFFLFSIIIIANLASFHSILKICPPILYAVSAYHAYRITPKSSSKSRQLIYALISLLLIIKLTVAWVPTWVNQKIERFTIPSQSMLPTLQVGDEILVNKSKNYLPQQGDVIVFKLPKKAQTQNSEKDVFFVKRVIGEPGQVIQVKNGVAYSNNQPLPETYIAQSPRYEFGPIRVPPAHYLVLGDNRNDSYDSHIWGFLPAHKIVGKAYKIYWPPNRIHPLN